MSHALCPTATYAAATSDALDASRYHARRAATSALAARSARTALVAERGRLAQSLDRLARARADRAAAEAL